MKRINLLCIIFALLISSCNQSSVEPTNEVKYETYKQFQEVILGNLNNLATFARKNGHKLNSTKEILSVSKSFYKEDNIGYNNFTKAVQFMESIKKSNERVLNTFENSVVNDLVENLNNSDSQDDAAGTWMIEC
ncbi:MAG: hypothetical protein ACJAWV_002867 [Flammeovirgaceae bacterium]|jgi:hypothetical protein